MKHILIAVAFMLSAALVGVHAFAKASKQAGYQTATVISVEKHVTIPTYVGSPSDAPLQTQEYSYDVGIRLNCNVYVGRYESATDYLPTDFATNHNVDVRLEKHVMYVSLSQQDRDIKLGIVSHKRLSEQACPVG